MFRLWAKAFKDNKMQWDVEIKDSTEDTRTHKVMNAIEKICTEKDLSVPVWFEKNIQEFKRSSKVKFRKDNFIDEVSFDYLECQIIEEDSFY